MPATVLSVLIVAMFLVTSLGAALGETDEPDGPETKEDEWVPNGVMQGEVMEPKVTPYYIKTLTGAAPDSGSLSPAALNESDGLAETSCNGPVAPRILINNLGTYRMYVSRMPLYIYGVNQVALWVKSNEDVQGAQFRVHLQRNGVNQRSMSTPASTLTSSPVELTVTNPPQNFPEPLIIMPGESLGLFIQYTARSRYPVGPAPGCIMLSSTLIHASRIELLASPMEMNVTAPAFAEGHMHVAGKIVDTSDVDPAEKLVYNLQIITSGGKVVKQSQIKEESFAPDEEKVIVNWSWDYKKAGEVVDGLYEFKLDVSYGVYGVNYTNSSFYEVEFPKGQQSDTGFLDGFNTLYLVIAIVAVLVAVVAFMFLRRSRSSYPPGYMAPRGPPKRGKPPKKKKLSKKEQRQIMAARGSPPPPRGPRSPDRTPMPGRGPPGGGAPPPKAPGAPRGAPKPGTGRPRR